MAPLDETGNIGSTPFEETQKVKQKEATFETQKREKLLMSIGSQADQYIDRAQILAPSSLDGKGAFGENKPYELVRHTSETPSRLLLFTDQENKQIPAIIVEGSPAKGSGYLELVILPDGSTYQIEPHKAPAPIDSPNIENISISRVSLPTMEGNRYPLWKGAFKDPGATESNFITLTSKPALEGDTSEISINVIHTNSLSSAELEKMDNLMRTSLLNTSPVS